MSRPPPERTAVQARTAGADDVDAVVALWIDLIDYHRSLDPDYPPLPSLRESLRAEARRGVSCARCLLAIAEPSAGFVFAEIESRPRVAPVGWIHELWVDPESRRRGVGRALVAAADEFFEKQGGARVSVRVERMNLEGLHFWKRLGFGERARILERSAQ